MIPLALGAALGCIALGSQSARRLARREKEMTAWDRALLRMDGHLEQGGLPLPLLLEKAGDGGPEALGQWSRLLSAHPALAPEELLARLTPPALLEAAEWDVIGEALQGLFAPTVPQQLALLRRVRGDWARMLESCRETAKKNVPLYRNLGWLSGAAFFILLC